MHRAGPRAGLRILLGVVLLAALAGCESELGAIEADVATLIRDMETSIAQSREFVDQMQLLREES